MCAKLYGNLRYRPRFADIRVNLRDGTTGAFPCQREQTNHELIRIDTHGVSP